MAGQASGQTRVRVTSDADTAGLPGAFVAVLQHNKVVYARAADQRGFVPLSLTPPYVVKVNYIGYHASTDTVREAKPLLRVHLRENTQSLGDVVVTAQYMPELADRSTYKIKVIDMEKIQKLAAVNLRDALSNELNFRFSQDNALSMSSLSLQGVSGENVKVLIDGVPMIGRQNGALDLSQINMNDVERIEIVEGPLSVNYGTNALAGVINIITKKNRKDKISAAAQLYYETSNTYNANVAVGVARKFHSLKLTGGRNYFNGWTQGEAFYLLPEKTLADTNRFKSWKPREQYFGTLDYGFEKKKLKLGFRSSLFDETIISRGLPSKPYYETAFDDYFVTRRFDNSANLNLKFNNYRSFNTIVAYNYYRRDKNTYYKDLTNLEQTLSGDASMQDTSKFTLLMARGSFISSKPYETYADTVKTINRLNYELGYDLNYEGAFGRRIENQQRYIGDYALFANAEIRPFRDFVIRPGLRYAYNTVYNTPVTPSLNLKYNAGNWIFRASYARGFRSPTLKELYFDFVDINHNIIGNTDLRAETSDNYNFSFRYKRDKKNKHYVFDHSLFYNNITNLITLANTSGTQYNYINVGKYITYGTSINTTFSYKTLSVSLGGAYTARYNSLSESYAGVSRFVYSPEGRASLQYEIEKIHTGFNVFYKYTGRLPGYGVGTDDQVYQTYIDAYHTLDANLLTRFFDKKLSLSVGAKNILNVINVRSNTTGDAAHSTASFSSPVSMGRTYFIKLDYVFSKL